MTKNNLIFIGMSGAGKSTVGVLAAKAFGMGFTDTDLLIQKNCGMLLQEYIDTNGNNAFLALEEAVLTTLAAENTVIATGGSAVYYPDAMEHLKSGGKCVWLSLPYESIERRIRNIKTRGIAIAPGKTLRDVFEERQPLYEKYADIIVNCNGSAEDNVAEIINSLK